MKRWHIVAVVGVIAVVAATVALGATIVTNAKTVTKVNVNRETTARTTSSTVFVDLPGSGTTINVPGGENALIVASFAGESQCSGGAAGNWCSLRITVDGAEMQPAAGLDFAFDSVATANDFWSASSIDRSAVVGPGAHVVKVQWAVTNAATVFRLDDWQLTTQRVQI